LNDRRHFAAYRAVIALFAVMIGVWLIYRVDRGPATITLRDGLVLFIAIATILLLLILFSNVVAERLEERTRERDALACVLVIAQHPIGLKTPGALAFSLATEIHRVTKTGGTALLIWDAEGTRIISAFAGLEPADFDELCRQTTTSPFAWEHAIQSLDNANLARTAVESLGMPAELVERYHASGIDQMALARIPLDAGQLGMIAVWATMNDPAIDRLDKRALVLIARQAGLAIQNARLLEVERRRALDRAQLLRVTGAATTGPHLLTALHAIAERTTGLSDFDSAAIGLYDADTDSLNIRAISGQPERVAYYSGRTYHLDAWPAALRQHQMMVLRPDDGRVSAGHQAMMEQLGITQMIIAPLFAGQELLGLLFCATSKAEPFDDDARQNAGEIAHATTLAIENARLVKTLRTQSDDRATLLAISRVISGATDLPHALDEVSLASLGLDGVDGTDIELVAESGVETEIVSLARRSPWIPKIRKGDLFPLTEWPSTVRLLATKEPLITSSSSPLLGEVERDAYQCEGIKSIALIPIVVNGQAIGMVTFLNRQCDQFPAAITRIGAEVAVQIAQLIERIRLQDALRMQATIDSLTGVLTRRAILAEMERCLLEAQRKRTHFVTIMVDLDNFKQVNDSLGHAAGDAVLRSTTQRFQDVVRGRGSIGRYGGDEFIIVLPNSSEREARDVVDRLYRATGVCIDPNDRSLGFSTGLALYPRDGDSTQALLHVADAQMYVAKRAVSRKP
jgi:diguanylate cyclase (GGDEF)-like protein